MNRQFVAKFSCYMDIQTHSLTGFPLTTLNLMDYCHITDVGISQLPSLQTTLTSLSLSRTKLTDQGMVFLEGQLVTS